MSSSIIPALLFFSIIITSLADESPIGADYRYSNCSQTFQCGNIANIGYPFWGQNRPEYCGHPKFLLNCSGQTPEINILSQQFRVMGINNMTYTLNLTRSDYWGTYCPNDYENTTMDYDFFNYTQNTQNIFLYYDCQPVYISPPITSQSIEFICDNTTNGNSITGYYVTRNLTSVLNLSAICATNVIVPVYQGNAQYLESNLSTSNLLGAIDGGFGLKWNASNSECENCVWSGGQCGFNKSTNGFICFCENGAHPSTCHPLITARVKTFDDDRLSASSCYLFFILARMNSGSGWAEPNKRMPSQVESNLGLMGLNPARPRGLGSGYRTFSIILIAIAINK
ncbi:Wall-associated receptor kinase, galacturonan-binding domain [Dillenia turbinata]|uniref:non-specific serine/threonine protein kinase n=1 Tax=Dillenia turbinata TaxID=194707 RepID=A0AAN8V709_9MAGN